MNAITALELDHVLIAVPDLAAGAWELETRHGLASVDGGRHPGWGTANRIVPFGDTYLELIAVIDRAEAAGTPFGRWVAEASSSGIRPFGWAVRAPGLEDVAQRLGLSVQPKSRIAPDGTELRWRGAGLEQAIAEPALPFFIEWDPGSPFPGRAATDHPVGNVRLERLELDGDAARLASWLGDHDLPIVVRPEAPKVSRVVLSAPAGEVALGDDVYAVRP